MSKADWDQRIARAEELAREYPFSAEILRFYMRVAAFQSGLYRQAVSRALPALAGQPSLREQLDVGLAVQHLPALFSLADQHGPPGLARAARELRARDQQQWLAVFSSYAKGEGKDSEPDQFFARACLQPYAEYIAATSRVQLAGYAGSICPLCNSRPLAAVLRPEGDGAKRSLLCSFCLLEWNYRRIVCPACGEQDHQKLPRYSAAEFPHIRVEACDTCKTYLKSLDLTVNGLAVPIVDEIAATPLDLWAGERGYHKMELNLIGC
jgi:FdhE protein